MRICLPGGKKSFPNDLLFMMEAAKVDSIERKISFGNNIKTSGLNWQ